MPLEPEDRGWIEIRPDHRGDFDEVVAKDVDLVHMEMMDDNCLWIRLDKGPDAQVFWIGVSGRSKLHITTKDAVAPPAPADQQSEDR